MKSFLRGLFAALLLTAFALPATSAFAKDKVVYHINDADSQAIAGLRNIRNQLDTVPDTEVIVVAHAKGVDFLMNDYKAKDGVDVASLVTGLHARGVKFEVCEITMKQRNLTKDQFVLDADFTPSGVVELTRLQQKGYAYIKP
ncbi:DsrE family protein [Pandoraea pneumonica]|jgi:intracellular sulfur oxidation DsrE/DsrF family protein|uniref:Signal peptide protein n=1 Tax=Pandoraea pneumonica TaxID=2508299 RepID=A0A5E4UX74_9BURK|nr:DsrE family protein [Pandoraea pneumonica]VVE03924.1 signal peptide protein [Pandoraea pneumonica]